MSICENVNQTAFSQNCLLKYITLPFIITPGEEYWHQNLLQVPLLASVIGEFGYNVDVVDWNDDRVQLNNHYDLIIDISPHNRHIYEQNLRPHCLKVLFGTGSSPHWQRRQEEARLENLYCRRGISLPAVMPHNYSYPPPDSYDAFFLIGNKHTLATFNDAIPAKTFLIKNTGYTLKPDTDFSRKSPRDFLFFASHPQVLKGLDLLLEAFSANKEATLHVCSLFDQEPDFCRAYDKELFHCPNIKAVGFINLNSAAFRELAGRCYYVILPSCSEGISGSILTAMSAGLIPIVSRECGLEEDEAFILEECGVNYIDAAIRYFARQPNDWLRTQSFRALAISQQRYNLSHYILSLRSAFEDLLGRPPGNYAPEIHLVIKRRNAMLRNLRVGIPLTGGNVWHGGVSYIETLVKSVLLLAKEERPQLFLVINNQTMTNLASYQQFIHLFDGVIYLGGDPGELENRLGDKPIHCQTWDELFSLIDFYYPVNSDVLPYNQAVSWIPDFQHRYLPEFFSGYEHQFRENQFKKIAQQAKLVILNSEAAKSDFLKYYPDSSTTAEVLSACPYPEDEWYEPSPEKVAAKYLLPERFILCSNQFWVHKNHSTLFEAISLVKKAGCDIHLVCTGPTEDYRAPGYFEQLQQQIDTLNIRGNITILGLIPRQDQLQLMRRCLFVIQPSLFEGLSLVVQECRALGKHILLSDIDVHREYKVGTTFNSKNSLDLAQKIQALLATCQPGPDLAAENQAKVESMAAAKSLGHKFCNILLDHLGFSQPAKQKKQPAKSPGHSQTITLLTSVASDNIPNQQAALQSWRQAGFKVIAVNAANDIKNLQPLFPEVDFLPVYRDAAAKFGKSYVYLRDLLDCCAAQPGPICGIVKADIIIKDTGILSYLSRQADGSLVFGSRFNVDSADASVGSAHSDGFDYLIFDKRVIDCYPDEDFCLGLYWWDYWALLMAIASDIPAKRLITNVFCHIKHEVSPQIDLWYKLGGLLARYAETDFDVKPATMAEYQQLLHRTIIDNSAEIKFPG